jgi:uncharacterized RDD family membrane protein YckC
MAVVAQQVCGSCGNPALPDGKFCLFCGDVLTELKEKAPQIADLSNSNAESETATPELPEYAGFWLRVWAGAIDVFIEAIGALLFSGLVYYSILLFADRSYGLTHATAAYVSGIAAIAFLSVGAWLYCAFTESSSRRATLGKRIVGLQVVTASGDKLTFGQATVRHFMKFLSLFTAAVGFMMAGWTKRRQALHDMPSDCVVVRVPPELFSILRR